MDTNQRCRSDSELEKEKEALYKTKTDPGKISSVKDKLPVKNDMSRPDKRLIDNVRY